MSNGDNGVPRTAEGLQTYARERMRAIIDKYKADGGVFTDANAHEKSTGLIYRSAGSVSLLLLANGFDALGNESSWHEIVTAEFDQVREHIKAKGFDATPFKQTSLFTPKGPHHYQDSVSWVLSFALHLRLAERSQKISLGHHSQHVKEMIKQALEIVRDSACESGGWGFTKGVSRPDLYYSYAVSESLADFGDYVLGESESEIGIHSDDELQAFLSKELIDQIQQKRKLTAKWLIRDYLGTLGSAEVDPDLQKDQHKKPHILLYYTYFVLDMLIVNIPDSFVEDPEDPTFKNAEEAINRGIEHAVYLSRINFDRARDTGKAWWDNDLISSLELSWENFENPGLLGRGFDPARTQLTEPGLVPLSLRCNALYAFYLAKGADRKMTSLFEILHDNRDPETGLWDNVSYSLMVTERAIEALVDYNDYFKRFESETVSVKSPETLSHMENAFRSYVLSAVKEGLQSSADLRSSIREVAAPAQVEPVSGDVLLGSLMTALNRGLRASHGESTGVDVFTYNQFRRQIDDVLDDVLVSRLLSLVSDGNKHNLIRDQYDNNKAALLKKLASWFASAPENTGGDLLQWLIEKVASESPKQKGNKK